MEDVSGALIPMATWSNSGDGAAPKSKGWSQPPPFNRGMPDLAGIRISASTPRQSLNIPRIGVRRHRAKGGCNPACRARFELDPARGLPNWGPGRRWFRSSLCNEDKRIRPVWHHRNMVNPAAEGAELQVVAVPAIEKRIFVTRDRQVRRQL